MFFSTSLSWSSGSQHPYKSHSLFRVLCAKRLLAGPAQKKMIKEIRALLSDVSDPDYDSIYAATLVRFVEFVQVLPVLEGGPLGTMLNLGLQRACIALQVVKEKQAVNPVPPLMRYAIFSVSLLQDVGWVAYRRRVMLSDEEGVFVKEWQPHWGPMPIGDYYKLRYLHNIPSHLNKMLNPLYSTRILPTQVLNSLAQDRPLFHMWLGGIEGNEERTGGLGLYLNMIQEKLKEKLARSLKPLPIPADIFEPEYTALGEAFWKWLRGGLQDGTLRVNGPESGVYVTPDGVLVTDAAFKQYLKTHQQAKTATSHRKLKKRFMELGLVGALAQYQYGHAQAKTQREGKKSMRQQLTAGALATSSLGNNFHTYKHTRPQDRISSHTVFTVALEGCLISDMHLVAAAGKSLSVASFLKGDVKKSITAVMKEHNATPPTNALSRVLPHVEK